MSLYIITKNINFHRGHQLQKNKIHGKTQIDGIKQITTQPTSPLQLPPMFQTFSFERRNLSHSALTDILICQAAVCIVPHLAFASHRSVNLPTVHSVLSEVPVIRLTFIPETEHKQRKEEKIQCSALSVVQWCQGACRTFSNSH